MKDIYKKALGIAIKVLRANYGKWGIYASPSKFRNYWARDSFISSFGSCVLGDFEMVGKNLDLFTKHQRFDGHIPSRIEESPHVWRVLGLHIKNKKLKTLDRQSQIWASDVFDSNTWYILSAINYLNASKDTNWFLRNRSNILKAKDWLVSKIDKSGLVNEGFIANWSDCSLRRGNILYTNILTWKALSELNSLAKRFGYSKDDNESKLKEKIIASFWDKKAGYFLDKPKNELGKNKYFYTDGNLLSILFGFSDRKKAVKILDFINRNNLNKIPVASGYPRMDILNDIVNKLIFPIYKTRYSFLWLGCLFPMCEQTIKDRSGALRDLQRLAQTIVRFKTCHEVLDTHGNPARFLFIESEKQQAWTAAMYIYAYKNIFPNERIS